MASLSPSSEISVIIPALNEGDNLRQTVEQMDVTLPPGSQVIVVDDGSTDDCAKFLEAKDRASVCQTMLLRTHRQGATAARNWGASRALGEILIFADAHIDVAPGWWQPLAAALDRPGAGAAAPVVSIKGKPESRGYGLRVKDASLDVEWLPPQQDEPYPVPFLPGCCLAIRSHVFEQVAGFDCGLIRWGSEDVELSLRLWLLGYEQCLVPSVDVAHLFRERHPYAINWTQILHNKLRLAFLHFSEQRIARVIESLKGYRDFAAALAMIAESDVLAERARLAARRRHDDNWFFDRFGMEC